MITLDLSILNQKGTPMFYSDIFANRPAAGVVGRIFISTDTYAIYRDTGSAWDQIGGSGSGITGSGTAGTLPIWSSSSALGDSLISQTSGVINAGGQLNITTGQPLTLGLQNLQLPTGVASTISAGLSVRTGVTGESIIQLGNNLNTYYTGNVDASKAGAMVRIDTRGVAPIPGSSAYSVFQIQTRSAGTADPNYTVPIQIAAAPSGSFCIDGSGYGYFYNRLRVGNSTSAPTNAVSITGNMDVAGYATFTPTQAAANNASSIAAYGQNTLSYAAGFSGNNIGAFYNGVAGFNLQTFAGSATFAQANLASALIGVNSIDFSSAGSTITMTQSSGIRAMTGNQVQVQYQGTNSGTITHAAIQQNLGFYRPSGASGTLTITNAYSHLINALDDYGAGFTFTNRWGIYQAGASDTNYFAASTLIGTNVIAGYKLDVNGTGRFVNQLNVDYRLQLPDLLIGYWDSTNNRIESVNRPLLITSYNQPIYIGQSGSSNLTIATSGAATFSSSVTATNGFFITGAGNAFQAIQTSATNNLTALIRQTGAGGNGNQDIGLVVDIQAANDQDRIANFRYYDGSTYTSRMAILRGGNVGINTLDPDFGSFGASEKILGISNTSARARLSFQNTSTGTSGVSGTIAFFNSSTQLGSIDVIADGATNKGYFAFNTNNGSVFSEKVRLTNEGNLIIGSTSNSGNKLYLNGSFRIDGQTAATAGGSSGQHLIINCDGTTYKIALLNN